jgi:hypothetical protein
MENMIDAVVIRHRNAISEALSELLLEQKGAKKI